MHFWFGLLAVVALAQQPAVLTDPSSVAKGEKLYLATCAGCHGPNLRGGEGPSLYYSRVVVNQPPRNFLNVLKNGIPKTEMIPWKLPEEQLWQIVAFVYSHARPGMGPPVAGDVEAGKAVFQTAGCAGCHMIGGKGGVLGPELSSIALQYSSQKIRAAILEPGRELAPGFATVKAVTRTGAEFRAALKNEDNFSVQLLKTSGEIVTLDRTELRELTAVKESLMPAPKLNAEELQNLLAYLDRQRLPVLRFPVTFFNY